jgi:hypothetical protein
MAMKSDEQATGDTSGNVERRPPEERRARLLLAIGAAVLFAGIALAVTDDETGRWLIVGGVGVLFLGLHRFGRLGPEDARA